MDVIVFGCLSKMYFHIRMKHLNNHTASNVIDDFFNELCDDSTVDNLNK